MIVTAARTLAATVPLAVAVATTVRRNGARA